MAEGGIQSRYVKLTKDQGPLEDIRPGELNQPIEVPQVSIFSLSIYVVLYVYVKYNCGFSVIYRYMRAFLFGINYTICGFASWFLWLLVEIRGRVFKVRVMTVKEELRHVLLVCVNTFLKKILFKKNEEEFGCTSSYTLRTYLCESGPNL